ncbi:MAG: hypothetical protein IT227_07185 [Flavobacteriales bacterium]|jgi:hypothetical protein|nr:hypothetical protein [Flavobacteriales bacterium]
MNTQATFRLLLLTSTLCGVTPHLARAQDADPAPAFGKGNVALNAGIGLGGVRPGYYGTYNDHYSNSPTFCLSAEGGVVKAGPGVIGVGGFLSHRWTRRLEEDSYGSVTYTYDERWTRTTIGARVAWHLSEHVPAHKLDLYAGVMLGYAIVGYRNESTRTVNGETTTYSSNSRPRRGYGDWSTFVGARYFFTRNVGAYAELGYGVSIINLGAAFRF